MPDRAPLLRVGLRALADREFFRQLIEQPRQVAMRDDLELDERDRDSLVRIVEESKHGFTIAELMEKWHDYHFTGEWDDTTWVAEWVPPFSVPILPHTGPVPPGPTPPNPGPTPPPGMPPHVP